MDVNLKSLTKEQADILLVHHARNVVDYITIPPHKFLEKPLEERNRIMRKQEDAIRNHIREMVAIAAIHYPLR